MSSSPSNSTDSISPDDEKKLEAMREGRTVFLKKDFREKVRNFFYTISLIPDDMNGPIDIALQVDRNQIMMEVAEEFIKEMRREYDAHRHESKD
jgi:hypothetical protein